MMEQPPDEHLNKKKDNFLIISIPIIITLLILIGLTSWLLFFAPEQMFLTQIPGIRQGRNLIRPFPEVTPKPTTRPGPGQAITPKPIGSGETGFTISGGNPNAPQFKRSFLDPIDPEQGEKQNIVINAYHSQPIESVEITIKTDNKEEEIEMSLTQGTKTNGTWEGNWIVDDTYLYNYRVIIGALSANATQEAEMILR